VPRKLFMEILERMGRLRLACSVEDQVAVGSATRCKCGRALPPSEGVKFHRIFISLSATVKYNRRLVLNFIPLWALIREDRAKPPSSCSAAAKP
jgi:hypothetical protein